MTTFSMAGFTLIELSIVLVIIGLIVGGVMVGRDLINAAKLRSILTDIEKFNVAALTFKNKYNCIPGDCANATDFFGTFTDCANDVAESLGNSTCNGTGNNQVIKGSYVSYWRYDESALFWQHLSVANLINGDYSGVMNWGGTIDLGTDVPVSRFEGGCYSINSSFYDTNYQAFPYTTMNGNFLSLGSRLAGEGNTNINRCTESIPSLEAIHAYNIDSKIDDGRPFTGSVQTTMGRYNGNWNYSGEMVPQAYPGCTNEDGTIVPFSSSAIIYDVAAPDSGCQLFFKAKF
jgi:prepilin-type N-terminal cleavage/methylation domain-containing protein